MDFNDGDMNAFKFTPRGQHVAATNEDLVAYLSRGLLPVGKLFQADAKFINKYSKCWSINCYTAEATIAKFSLKSPRSADYIEVKCGNFFPAVYKVLGIKNGNAGYGQDQLVIFLQSTIDKVREDLNAYLLSMCPDIRLPTALQLHLEGLFLAVAQFH